MPYLPYACPSDHASYPFFRSHDPSVGSASVPSFRDLYHTKAPMVNSSAQSMVNCFVPQAKRSCGASQAARSTDSNVCQSAGSASATNAAFLPISAEPAVSCAVCHVLPRDALLLPCYHVSCCQQCAQLLMAQGRPCPTCASSVLRTVPIRLEQAVEPMACTPATTTAAHTYNSQASTSMECID